MGVALELVDFDELFHRGLSKTPIIINDYSETSEDDKDSFNKLIYTKYSNDLLSNLPSCECGKVEGQHNARDGDKPGVVCDECHTECVASMEQDLEPIVWMRTPKGLPKRGLINPILWTMLNDKFTRSGFEILRWITDTTYKPSVRTPAIMEQVQELGIERGYSNFINHFDDIIEALFGLLKPAKGKKGDIDPLHALIKMQRNCVFSEFLPLPNRSLIVIEETNVGIYVDPIITGAVDAIRTMVGIDAPTSNFNLRTRENRTVKTLAGLAAFNDDLARSTLAKKEGIFRKHVFGTRSHFSCRGVITSTTDDHHYDEIYVPWGMGVSSLSIHLTNKLLRDGFTPNEAKAYLYEHAQKYSERLDAYFQEFIAECPYKGLPVVFQRNPSLERGSAQAMFITRIKTQVDDPTISLSILAVVGFNADFDGDQLNCTHAIDNWTADQLQKLAPHMSVFGLDQPRAVSRNLSMPKPVVSTIAAWMHGGLDAPEPDKQSRMLELFGDAPSDMVATPRRRKSDAPA